MQIIRTKSPEGCQNKNILVNRRIITNLGFVAQRVKQKLSLYGGIDERSVTKRNLTTYLRHYINNLYKCYVNSNIPLKP